MYIYIQCIEVKTIYIYIVYIAAQDPGMDGDGVMVVRKKRKNSGGMVVPKGRCGGEGCVRRWWRLSLSRYRAFRHRHVG